MAKISVSKLGLKTNSEVTTIPFGEGVNLEVQKYLPIKDKLELITRIINNSIDDNGYWNPIRVKVFMTLEIMYAYTNINFTEKMKEDMFKTYDLVVSTGLFDTVIDVIDPNDWKMIKEDTWASIKNIYNYKNSVGGILEMVSTDYSNVKYDLDTIQQQLADPNSLKLLKEILPLTNGPSSLSGLN